MLKNYFNNALRNFLKYKTFSLINIIGLAIGFASCLVITIYVLYESSYENFQSNADRIFRVVTEIKNQTGLVEYATTPSSLTRALKNDYSQVEYAARLMTNPEMIIRAKDKKFSEDGIFHADLEILNIFKVPFIYGDPGSCLDRPRTVVISQSIAEKYFGNTDPIGKVMNFGYALFEVTGVVDLPSNSHLKFNFLTSLKPFERENWQDEGWTNVDGQTGLVYTYVQFVENSNVRDFEKELKNMAGRYPGVARLKSQGIEQNYFLQPIRSIHLYSNMLNEIKPPGSIVTVNIFTTIAIVILILGCMNFVNLSTARYTTRYKEVGMRKVMGATRPQLIKQFVAESLLLSIISLVIAIGLVELALPGLSSLSEAFRTKIFSATAILIITVISMVAGCAVGIYPALLLSSFHPLNVLKGESATKIAGISFRKILFIFQFAVSLILIAGMLLVYQQLQFMKNYDLGFDRDHLIVLPIPTGFLFDKNSEEFISNEFQKHSGITSATTTSCIPGMNKNIIKGSFKLLGKTGDDNCSMNIMMVDPDFPNTYGVELIAGRSFENRQGIQSGNTCLINESARKVLGLTSAEEAVGKFLTDFDNHEIIGVLSDFHYCSLQHKIEPLFLTVNPDFYMYLTLKYNSRNSNEIVNFVKQQWAKLFPGDPFEYYFFDEIFEKQYLAENKFINVIFIFTVLAVFIACLGLYGLMLFTVERKTKEICIRKVFGSSISGIMTLLLKNYTGWILFSNILSIPLAYYLITNWLQNFAYRIEISWWIFILSGGIALVIALATVSFQAIKTATANPVEALRYE